MKEILLFGKALLNKHTNQEFDDRFVIMAAEKGYIIHPNCDYNRVNDYLKTLPNNFNTTFYKSFDAVRQLTTDEIMADKIKHYASTYGKTLFNVIHEMEDENKVHSNLYIDFTGIKDIYVPNEDPIKIDIKDCKVMLPISKDEIFYKIDKSFKSGIALEKDTINNMFNLSDEIFGEKFEYSINDWKNKEAIILYKFKKNWPAANNEEFIRMLFYITTDNTLVIQDKRTIENIKSKSGVFIKNKEIHNLFKNYDLTKLSESFNRYKKLFLAIKKVDAKTINKISSLSKKHHKPMDLPFVSTFLNKNNLNDDLEDKLMILKNQLNSNNINIFQKEKWLQAIRKRLLNQSFYDCYNIRNGKSFYQLNNNFNNLTKKQQDYLQKCKDIIYKSMVKDVKKKVKDCNIIVPQNINFVVPTSEKNFIGHIPFNSFILLDGNNNGVVGITWKGKDGAQDLDLSYLSAKGKCGWNADYESESGVVYSGDMTSANPEATEMFYCPKGIEDGILSVNNYNGKPESLYHFFIAKDHTDYNDKCVNPDNILFQTPLKTGNKSEEKSIGIFVDNIFYFVNRNSGYGRVSSVNDTTIKMINNQSYANQLSTHLEVLLIDAGAPVYFNEIPGVMKDLDKKTIDLTTTDKTVLLDLLS